MEHIKLTDRELKTLLAILRCGANAYGPRIGEELTERTGESTSLGALYSTLDRLQDKDLVETKMGEATPERGGKRKKFYRVNAAGELAMRHATLAVDRLREGIFMPETLGGSVLT